MSERLLIVDDDPSIVTGLQALLQGEWEVQTATNGRDARATFANFSPDVALLDIGLPDVSGIELLHDFKMYSEAVAVIMMSGAGTMDRVVESMRLGAETFLQKPFDYDTLQLTLAGVKKMIATQHELQALRRADAPDTDRLPGISPAVQRLNELLAQVARVPSPVLIEGESGTGKGVFAGIPSPFTATRYHSLSVRREDLPEVLDVTAWTQDDEIMGFQHKSRPVHGVQFHPESIATEYGHELLGNFLDLAGVKRLAAV